MQKKTLLSACIALALSGSGWAADIDDTDSATRQRKETRIPCPTAHSSEKLSPQQLKSLPSECSTTNDNNLYSLIAVGATSLITTLAVLELNHDDGNHAHSSDNPPVPPDDDNGGNTPDDGGNTPDDGGNTPDDGGHRMMVAIPQTMAATSPRPKSLKSSITMSRSTKIKAR
ncbi:hypothetical protein [Escherichia coli]|uniref:hypothetical protein n=1 Tax=Escherichia coli TaxID=562 RepID=UPI003F51967A